MQNDAGEVVDLYLPRKWYVPGAREAAAQREGAARWRRGPAGRGAAPAAARDGGARWRREQAARAGGASWRREQAARAGGATRRRDQAAQGGATGLRVTAYASGPRGSPGGARSRLGCGAAVDRGWRAARAAAARRRHSAAQRGEFGPRVLSAGQPWLGRAERRRGRSGLLEGLCAF
jgi:hypothetical protein